MKRDSDANVIPFPGPGDETRDASQDALPSPVTAFTEWLKSVPPGVPIEVAALTAIDLIDRRALPCADVQILRTLLAAVAGPQALCRPVSHR